MAERFKVRVTKDHLVFAAAHFITLPGDRCEPLHGHNYRTRVAVAGALDPEAHFIFDFSALKQLMRELTGELDHKVLLPLANPKLAIRTEGDTVTVAYEGRPRYVFPTADCALLPIPNTTVEMLAQYLVTRARAALGRAGQADRLSAIEVEVEENFGQSATYRESFA
jgi:6-pyruvoyltetrahydropterin/6-carboxytetrahydropterin synthase